MPSWRRSLGGGPTAPPRPALKTRIEAGMMVTPNVRLVERLGEGAMGEVWVADHLTLKTQVAVKFISEELDPDNPEVLTRFEREASTAARIKSPFVVQTFDQGVTPEGTPYIVMELLEGESLGDRLDRTGWISLQQAAQILTQTAKALGAAHKAGIIHRDIKPDNLFLLSTDDGFMVKVLDFGIAKEPKLSEVGGLTVPGTLVGTPEFMSPDQILSPLEITYRVDLWALAVTMYTAITGDLPFVAPEVDKLCVEILAGKYPPPSELRPDVIGPKLDAWFDKALRRKPEERFESAKEMALAFVRAIPPGGDLFEDELLVTGEHVLESPTPRAPTAIGMGGGKLPVPKPPPARKADAVRTAASPAPQRPETSKTSDAITMPRFTPPGGARRKRALVAGVAALLVLGGALVFIALAGGDAATPAPAATDEARPATAESAAPTDSTTDAAPEEQGTTDATAQASASTSEPTEEPAELTAPSPPEPEESAEPTAPTRTARPTLPRPTQPKPRPTRKPPGGTPLPDPGF